LTDEVFISGTSGNLYALDASTGSQIWTISLGGTMTSGMNGYGLMQASGLSAGGGILVVPVGNKLTAFTLSTNP
jgi:outer membrane protein assembly factor BamB